VSGSLDPRMRQEDQEKPLLDDWGKGDSTKEGAMLTLEVAEQAGVVPYVKGPFGSVTSW